MAATGLLRYFCILNNFFTDIESSLGILETHKNILWQIIVLLKVWSKISPRLSIISSKVFGIAGDTKLVRNK